MMSAKINFMLLLIVQRNKIKGQIDKQTLCVICSTIIEIIIRLAHKEFKKQIKTNLIIIAHKSSDEQNIPKRNLKLYPKSTKKLI